MKTGQFTVSKSNGSIALAIIVGSLLHLGAGGDSRASVATFVTTGDTTLLQGTPTDNYGTGSLLSVGSWFDGASAPNRQSSTVDFNVSSLSGQYLSINSITLKLSFFGVNNTANVNRTTQVYEFSAGNAGWTETGATWNTRDGATNWAGSAGAETPTTDYVNTLLASNTINTGGPLPPSGSAINFVFAGSSAQLTTLMNNWVVNMPGFLLREGQTLVFGQDLNRVNYYASDAGVPALAPTLIVDYNLPEPSAAALLLVSGGSLLRRRRAA